MLDFLAPTDAKCKEALIGSNNVLKKLYNKTFSPRHRQFHTSQFFRSVQIMNDADWLLHHKESGQTFESFWRTNIALGHASARDQPLRPVTALGHYRDRSTNSTTPSGGVKVIYIQPLGHFPKKSEDFSSHPFIIWLQTYCNAFFYSAKIRILPPITVNDVKCEYRVNGLTGRFQLNASNILTYLRKHKPRDSHCVIAVTMIDLFPKPSWDFVFGLASSTHGVGVFSFARYEDVFYETWTQGKDVLGRLPDGSLDYSPFTKKAETIGENDKKGILLLRACKVMSHEICHMFGLKHCFYYQCVMNGSNHLQESDRRPPFLCPVCLRKLQAVFEFNIEERYEAMKKWASPTFWENYLHHDHKTEKPPQRNNSALTGRRGSLSDVTKPKSIAPSFARQSKTFTTKNLERRPVTCKPSSTRSKPALSSSITRRPTTSTPKSTTSSVNGLKQSCDVQKLKSCPPKGFKTPAPPLDAFEEYLKWLHDAIKFLQSDE